MEKPRNVHRELAPAEDAVKMFVHKQQTIFFLAPIRQRGDKSFAKHHSGVKPTHIHIHLAGQHSTIHTQLKPTTLYEGRLIGLH